MRVGCRRSLRVRRWLEGCHDGNFGDALNLTVLNALGFRVLPSTRRGSANPGRCLFAIGSILSPWHISQSQGAIDVWGAGWRGEPLTADVTERLSIHAVRGPDTAHALGLTDVPLGDPALLLPLIHPIARPGQPTGTLLIPHILERRCPPAESLGCSTVVSMAVRQTQPANRQGRTEVLNVVDRIASAEFVLTGSLHAAIVAQAYGVPWSVWTGTGLDCPAKWDDWAHYLNIEISPKPDRRSAEKWWSDIGSGGTIAPTVELLRAFPYRGATLPPDESVTVDVPGPHEPDAGIAQAGSPPASGG